MPIKTYEDLVVWQQAHQWTLAVYQLTQVFPRHEAFGLTSQLRRSAASIPANIVEGFARGRKEFSQFLAIANGSLEETKYHLRLAKDLAYIDEPRYRQMHLDGERLGKLLRALRVSLRTTTSPS